MFLCRVIFFSFLVHIKSNSNDVLCFSVPNMCVLQPGICQNGAQCAFLNDGGYKCTCVTGFTGSNCQTSKHISVFSLTTLLIGNIIHVLR